jgi:uncharacterized protein (TIGR02466 family)
MRDATLLQLFPTLIYRAELPHMAGHNYELETAALTLARDDAAGRKWSERHGYPGYTSYASRYDLARHLPVFAALVKKLDRHAQSFAKALHWDLRGQRPICDSLWVNVMPEGGSHTSHIHTNAVMSGTYYVAVPEGSGPIVYEDPRLPLKMAAPPMKQRCPRELKPHASEYPNAGSLLLWESWLRHEVPLNRAAGNRISVSFNYVIGEN